MDEAIPAEESAQVESTQTDTTQATDGSIKLGGGIELKGFDVEKAHLVVVKKIVGNYVKEMTEKAEGFEKVIVNLTKEGESYSIKVELTASGNQTSAEVSEKNLFIALNNVLKEVVDKI